MNNPNPFVPQGSLLEQHKRRSRMKLAVFCAVALSVCGLSAMLIQGCKREQTADNSNADTNSTAIDTNATPVIDTNAPVVPPTNQVVAPVVAPVVPVVPAASETTEYVVVKGDTLGKIAKANHVTLKALEDANPNVTPTKLKVGQKLQVPASTGTSTTAAPMTSTSADMTGGETYTVKSGDTLSKIAKVNGVSLKALEAANPNVQPAKIKVGQKLNIPVKAEAAAATTVNTPPVVSSPAPVTPAPAPGNPPPQQ